MTAAERLVPAMNADERTTLETWLDFYRATLMLKCDGLDGEQLRADSARPSELTLQGLVQHLAEVERNWFRRVLTGEDIAPIYPRRPQADGHDGGFELLDAVSFAAARAAWETEVAVARDNCSGRDLAGTSAFRGTQVSLRWIYIHMIGEYARHCGHADLLRERIDGTTGV
ncbi:DinB family protein [Rhodococcus sp. D2-41]|uniref:DinB family protein n=1 Tax=Speluncibacter jeojiensis TaxID=2710754 RepID=A0A9X4LXX1_9ACTN|nr:DinB family protein [Rhodococcus sp. D2-41]MDG3010602.1 DinB family protein [Rhodococcus sp. D2-41]MDG3014349.1 DinB family protein [Corynebacteriales bacterium D3-21]